MKQRTSSWPTKKSLLWPLHCAEKEKYLLVNSSSETIIFQCICPIWAIFCSFPSAVPMPLLQLGLVLSWGAAGILHIHLCRAEFGCQQFVMDTSCCMRGMFSAEWQLSNLSLHVLQIKKPENPLSLKTARQANIKRQWSAETPEIN